MATFAIVALVLAVFAVGVMVVSARELLRNIRKLNEQLRATSQRLAPLSEELQSELAVTSVEIDGLSEQVARLQTERRDRAEQEKVRNLGRKRQRSRRRR